MAERILLSQTGGIGTYQIEVKDRTTVNIAQFDHPVDATAWKLWVASLGGADLDRAFEYSFYATDLKVRAKNRESVAAESTVVKRHGREFDLMTLAIPKAVAAVNAAYEGAYAFMADDATPEVREATILKLVPGPFRTTRRKLVEENKAIERDGRLRPR